jgi:hypothetical protein
MRNCVEEEIQESGDSFRIISSPRETLVTGPLIEIVAPTSIHGLPSTPLAFLALSVLELAKWGNAEVIQVDSIQSGQFGALHGVTLWPQPPILGPANRQIVIPTTISEDQLKALDCHLACIMESQPIAEKLFVPLRWYLRARGSSDDLDTFASAFIGLEGLISAHSQEAGTVSRIQKLANDPQVAELLGSLRGEYPDAHVDQLVRRLSHVGPSLLDHVEAITASLSLSPEATNQFRRAQKQRGAVLHGSKDQITPEWATWAIDTLGEVIRAVLIDSGCSC